MVVHIIDFPETPVAVAEHRGPPQLEYETARRLIAWRIANRLHPDRHASYGIHYTNPATTAPADHRVDFCVAFSGALPDHSAGILLKTIPAARCAVVRHRGSREEITAATYLHTVWLPESGEVASDLPMFFHYVNVGPQVAESDMITDVYLPLI